MRMIGLVALQIKQKDICAARSSLRPHKFWFIHSKRGSPNQSVIFFVNVMNINTFCISYRLPTAFQLLEYQMVVAGGQIWYSREIGLCTPCTEAHPPWRVCPPRAVCGGGGRKRGVTHQAGRMRSSPPGGWALFGGRRHPPRGEDPPSREGGPLCTVSRDQFP